MLGGSCLMAVTAFLKASTERGRAIDQTFVPVPAGDSIRILTGSQNLVSNQMFAAMV
jgi:hypothetical protein